VVIVAKSGVLAADLDHGKVLVEADAAAQLPQPRCCVRDSSHGRPFHLDVFKGDVLDPRAVLR
jgi:hypothetical protein